MHLQLPGLLLLCCLFSIPAFAQQDTDRDFTESFRENAGGIIVRNLRRLNSTQLDFSPALYQNGLVFVTSRQKGGYYDKKTKSTYFELFYADLTPEGLPDKAAPFSIEVNSRLHEGPVCFSADGRKMYLTRNNIQNGVTEADKNGKIRLQIMEADRGELDWENIRPLPFNNKEYSCMHPAVSEDGKRMFFVSDMPGGYGGLDIYLVEKIDGSWSDPINLGPDINTRANEGFPYLHHNNTLFFASEGHKGLGGLDLFMIDIGGRSWGNVINLGAPFNSEKDDFSLVMIEDATRGYFSSNRDGGKGRDDLYMFETPDGLIRMEDAPQTALTRINVQDAEGNFGARDVNIRIFEYEGRDPFQNKELYNVELSPAAEGEAMSMQISRKAEEDLPQPIAQTDKDGSSYVELEPEKKYIVLLSKAGYKSKEMMLEAGADGQFPPVIVKLDRLRCVTLNGRVINTFNKKPIPRALVRIANSCGEKEQVVRADLDGYYEHCLEIGCDYTVRAQKDGFQENSVDVPLSNVRGSRSFTANIEIKPGSGKLSTQPLQPGAIIVLDDIQYDFGKSAIQTGATRDLEALATLMRKYPDMEVEVGAHTDSRGEASDNLSLSFNRAEAAKRYLVNRGINGRRIRAYGYGEGKLRNHCRDGVECSEEQHQYNRRIEIKILQLNQQIQFSEANEKIRENRR